MRDIQSRLYALTSDLRQARRVRLCVALTLSLMSTGCAKTEVDSDLVWAVNIGGPAYSALDGSRFKAESHVDGGTVGHIEQIKGSQDPVLYQSYRKGDIRITRPIANGDYDVTLHFAEPDDSAAGARIFDVFMQEQLVFKDIDVMLFRDGKIRSALTVTQANVVVEDGQLDIRFEASVGEPVVSAIVVRNKQRPAKPWQLVWQDEFESDGMPDSANWNIEEWAPRKVNDEDQAYTAREKNLRVNGGILTIEAHREDFEDGKYTSGRIQSSGKADFLYGRFEVRAKLPRGQGTWPAIWMLPSNPFKYATTCEDGADWQGSGDCDAWPNSGEIDIMEHVGYQMGHIHGTVHNEAYYWLKWEQRKGRVLIDDVADEFHVYAVEWSPERIDAFVGDTLYFTYINENAGWEAWPFDQPFHMILNIAVGGGWGRAGGPIDDASLPQQMNVDYVRIYQLEAD